MTNAFVYVHKNPSTHQVFYVGIGKNSRRPSSYSNRNIHWVQYVGKHGHPIIEVVYKNIPWWLACEIERVMIWAFGKSSEGGVLVNMTDGGDGAVGVKYGEEALKIKKAAMNRPEVKEKLRQATLKQWESKEFRAKISLSSKRRMIENNPNNYPGAKEKQRKHARENNSFSMEDVRIKLRNASKIRFSNPENRAKLDATRLKGVEASSKKVTAIDANENVLLFSSVRQAALHFKIGHSTVSSRIKSNKLTDGYSFKYA